MALQKLNIGTNEDGTPRSHFHHEAHPDEAVVITGPWIQGSVTVADGTVYDVTEHVIVVKKGHEGEVAHAIGVRFEEEGHPTHKGEPFFHHCTDHCGALVRDVTDPFAAAAADLALKQTLAILDADTRNHHAEALRVAGAISGGSMARASVTAENAALNGLDGTGATNVIPDVSAHTADPGTTGASENANTGGYARVACSWNAAASGAKTNSSSLSITTAGSVAVTALGTWSSLTYAAGNYAIGMLLSSSVTAVTITVAAGAISLSAS